MSFVHGGLLEELLFVFLMFVLFELLLQGLIFGDEYVLGLLRRRLSLLILEAKELESRLASALKELLFRLS